MKQHHTYEKTGGGFLSEIAPPDCIFNQKVMKFLKQTVYGKISFSGIVAKG